MRGQNEPKVVEFLIKHRALSVEESLSKSLSVLNEFLSVFDEADLSYRAQTLLHRPRLQPLRGRKSVKNGAPLMGVAPQYSTLLCSLKERVTKPGCIRVKHVSNVTDAHCSWGYRSAQKTNGRVHNRRA